MAYHPVNLFLRFCLELIAVFTPAYWAWSHFSGWLAVLLVIFIPLALFLVWGVFAVPGDRSRSGKTVVKTAGWCRLIIEGVVFIQAAVVLFYMNTRMAIVYSVLVLIHHLFSMERIRWLLKVD
jgi:hypothetical protein